MLTPFLVAEMAAAAVLQADQLVEVFLAQAALADPQQIPSNCIQGHGPAVSGAFRS